MFKKHKEQRLDNPNNKYLFIYVKKGLTLSNSFSLLLNCSIDYFTKSTALAKASEIHEEFFPPAVAKNG